MNSPGRWLLAVSLIVCLLVNIPYLVGYFFQGDDTFGGVTVAPGDMLTYFAKMNQGRQGYWGFQIAYSAPTHERQPLFLHYIFLGHIARILRLSSPLLFHACRVLFVFLFISSVYWFSGLWTQDISERRFITLLAAVSSGIGWLVALTGHPFSNDITLPESIGFMSMMGAPHFVLGQILLLVVWWGYLTQKDFGKTLIISVLATALIALMQVYMVLTVLGTGGLYGLILWRRQRRFPWQLAAKGIAGAGAALPLVWMAVHAMTSDPVLKAWVDQNDLSSPRLVYFVTGYGLLLIPAGIALFRKKQTEVEWLIVCWLAVTVIMLHAPTLVQRRFTLGLHLPVCFLAGQGIYRVLLPRQNKAAYLFLAATVPTNFMLILVFSAAALLHHPDMFMMGSEAEALAWLRENAPENRVVLSSTPLGAFIPAYTDQRVVSGHIAETIDRAKTEAEVKRFFAADTPSHERRQLLRQWEVTYVMVGERERELGIDTLTISDGVLPLVTIGDTTIYAVNPEELEG